MVYSDGKKISSAHSKGAEEGKLKCDVFNHGPGYVIWFLLYYSQPIFAFKWAEEGV